MSLSDFNLSSLLSNVDENAADSNANFLRQAIACGLNTIRCKMTGKAIGTIDDSELVAAYQVEKLANPIESMDQIIDRFALKHAIVSSRSSPLFTNHNNDVYMLALKQIAPLDLFAYLTGKLLFNTVQHEKQSDSFMNEARRMQWLMGLWDAGVMVESEEMTLTLETLIRIDAIHHIKFARLDQRLMIHAENLRAADDYSIDTIGDFVMEVESFLIGELIKSDGPVKGNAYAVKALWAEIDAPESLLAEEELKQRLADKKRDLYTGIGSRTQSNAGKVTVRRKAAAIASLAENYDTLNPAVKAKYQHIAEDMKAKKAADKRANSTNPDSKAEPKKRGRKAKIGGLAGFTFNPLLAE